MWNDGAHLREIAGATLGLIGVGSIGRRVAQMASALGMRVIAVREHVEKGVPKVLRLFSRRPRSTRCSGNPTTWWWPRR